MSAAPFHGPRVRRTIATLTMAASLPTAGCTVGPDFHQPHPWSAPTFASVHGPTLANDVRAGSLPVPTPPDPAWWGVFDDLGIDVPFYSQRTRPIEEVLPWDHIHVKKGREYLAKEQGRSVVQLTAMAEAV